MLRLRVLLIVSLICARHSPALFAQTPPSHAGHADHAAHADHGKHPDPAPAGADDWVALATRIHGGFGSYVALGIRIGLDALADLGVARGDVEVTLIDGPENRCPCVADGLLLATGATPGRATLHVDSAKAPPGVIGIVVVRHPRTNRTLRYTVLHDMRDQLDAWNQLQPAATLQALMHAPAAELYRREGNPHP